MRSLPYCLALLSITCAVSGFVPKATTKPNIAHSPSGVDLGAKKKKKGSSGQGFGKEPVVQTPPPKQPPQGDSSNSMPAMMEDDGSILKSVEGGSTAKPQIDPNAPIEERTASILRNTYGLRTLEEQQEQAKKDEAVREQRKKLEEWKKMADDGQEFDLMAALPEPVLVAIDGFLKAGVAICTTLFVLAGLAITVEAWSKASDSPLPENIDQFIVNTIEPNFTPGLLVLLGFSVSLGAFAAAQLASSSSTYREDR